MKPQPMQPLEYDERGVLRFRENAIVRYLLDNGGIDMNHLAGMSGRFSRADQMQFAQLIGYSLSGYADLSYVTDASYAKAVDASKRVRVRKRRAQP